MDNVAIYKYLTNFVKGLLCGTDDLIKLSIVRYFKDWLNTDITEKDIEVIWDINDRCQPPQMFLQLKVKVEDFLFVTSPHDIQTNEE